MTTQKNVGKYLWIAAVTFITYLLLGSFIVSKDLADIIYLVILYTTIIYVKFSK